MKLPIFALYTLGKLKLVSNQIYQYFLACAGPLSGEDLNEFVNFDNQIFPNVILKGVNSPHQRLKKLCSHGLYFLQSNFNEPRSIPTRNKSAKKLEKICGRMATRLEKKCADLTWPPISSGRRRRDEETSSPTFQTGSFNKIEPRMNLIESQEHMPTDGVTKKKATPRDYITKVSQESS